jgi:CrcB protein
MTAPETDSLSVGAPRPARQRAWRAQAPVVAVVALGGVLGAFARYRALLWWPTPPGGFPWATFWTNVAGCAVMGVFMVVVTEVWAAHRLVRPFFGTGVLGGFTTFSTYAVDIQRLTDADHPRAALAYLAGTLCAALAAVWLGATAARRVLKWRRS